MPEAPDPKVASSSVMPDNFLGALVTGQGRWDDQNATVAMAVALAESGGKPGAVGHNTNGSSDWGLWQINDHAHPELFTASNWADPSANADMAFKVWQQSGGKWSAWSTYNSGKYQMYMGRAQTAIRNRDANGYATWLADYDNKVFTANGYASTSSFIAGFASNNPLGDILTLIGKIFSPKTWISVGILLAGSVMLLLVGWQLLKGDQLVNKVTKTVKTASKVGAVLS